MVEHRHRLDAAQKKWLTERELSGKVKASVRVAKAVVEPGLASDRLTYWQAIELTGVIEDAIELAEEALEASDRLQRGVCAVGAVGDQGNAGSQRPCVVIKRRF